MHFYHNLPEALGLNAALSNPTSNFALRNSWVIDGASHVHVCNMRDRFESIEPCHQVLLTGDNSTYVWITKADGSKKMRMLWINLPCRNITLSTSWTVLT
jgi:hypothetical protein